MILQFLEDCRKIIDLLIEDRKPLHGLVSALGKLQRRNGRLFVIGVGGSGLNALHLASDLRKLAGIQCFTPFDNVGEISARINDEGWESCFSHWMRTSRLGKNDMVLILSVGGGNKKVSAPIVKALDYANEIGVKIAAITGRNGGYCKNRVDILILIPTVNKYLVTPFVEVFQVVIGHLLSFHPDLMLTMGKWEEIIAKSNDNIDK